MKITILKKQGKSEVINREELSDLVDAIKNGLMRVSVEHMASFDYGYKIAAVRDWLFKQSK